MFSINLNSPEPIYTQIIIQLKNMLEKGELKGGDSLPPLRSLASQLDIAVNTVARAYRELESEGIIISNGRRGSFIQSGWNPAGCKEVFSKQILSLFDAGLTKEQILLLFTEELNRQETENE